MCRFLGKQLYSSLSLMPFLLGLFVCLNLVSCASSKQISYLQDIVPGESISIKELEPRIQVGDVLAITVNSRNLELAIPFNLPLVSYASKLSGSISQSLQMQGYLVESDGTINYPLIGRIFVSGLTKGEVVEKVSRAIINGNYLSDPIVTVSYLNFKISVLGEVNKPGTFAVEDERVTLFQALGLAGDLTIYGRRDNVIVLREVDGERVPYVHDLRSSAIFDSPGYFLQQNDIVIVTPNKIKAQTSGINTNNNTGVIISVLSTATSVATLIVTVLRSSK